MMILLLLFLQKQSLKGKSSQGSIANGKRRESAVSGGRRTTVTTGRVTMIVLRDKNHRELQGEVGA
jgi:hypothetical protein